MADWSNLITIFVSQTFLVFFVYLLTEFREPEAKWRRIWLVGAVGITAANLVLVASVGFAFYEKWFPLTMTAWHLALILLVSRRRGARTLFNLFTVLYLGFFAIVIGRAMGRLLPGFPLADCLARIVVLLALTVAVYRLRPPYLRMLGLLQHGWTLLCAFPLLTVGFIYALSRFENAPLQGTLLALVALALGAVFYGVVWLFFQRVLEEDAAQRDKDLLSVQVSSMEQRVAATQAAEEQLRIERHDLRHRLAAIATLARKNDQAALVEYIGASQALLDAMTPVRRCANPMLDAITDFYFRQAEEAGIAVETSLSVPPQLPVAAAELSTVLANALENAIHACKKLPQGQRRIVCKCIAHPSLMLEVSNTCDGRVSFDQEGRPVTAQHDHGLGVRSIAAFCDKYGALCTYELQDGWFRLKLAL